MPAGRPAVLFGGLVSVRHYYGDGYHAARADTITLVDEFAAQLRELAAIGVTGLLLYPCSGDIDQVAALANTLGQVRPVREEVTP